MNRRRFFAAIAALAAPTAALRVSPSMASEPLTEHDLVFEYEQIDESNFVLTEVRRAT